MQLCKIADGLSDLPVIVEDQIDWGLDDLIDIVRAGVFPIVALDLRHVDGVFAFHAVVVVDRTQDSLVLHDPLHPPSSRAIGLPAFEAAWNAAEREAVTITSG